MHRIHGFSLVELMVALLLGAVVTTGIVQMFTATQQSNQVLQGQARIQENARYALDFIGRELRMTGFMGCVADQNTLHNAMDVDKDNPTSIPWSSRMVQTLQGFNDTNPNPASPAWTPALTGLPTAGAGAINIATIAPGTDVLVIRHAADEALRLTVSQVTPVGNLITEPPADAAQWVRGTVLMVSDCNKAALFQRTNSGAAATMTVEHLAAGGLVPGNEVQALSQSSTVFDVDSNVYRITTSVFFIAPGAGTNNRGTAPLSLWRKLDNAAPEELVEGVANLQVLYGEDTDADGVPNRYRTFDAVVDQTRIVAVRVTVSTNSVNVMADGQVPARNFEMTVAIRNSLT